MNMRKKKKKRNTRSWVDVRGARSRIHAYIHRHIISSFIHIHAHTQTHAHISLFTFHMTIITMKNKREINKKRESNLVGASAQWKEEGFDGESLWEEKRVLAATAAMVVQWEASAAGGCGLAASKGTESEGEIGQGLCDERGIDDAMAQQRPWVYEQTCGRKRERRERERE